MVSIEKKLTNNEERVDRLIRTAVGDKSAWGASFSDESKLELSQLGGSVAGGGSVPLIPGGTSQNVLGGGSIVLPQEKEGGVSFKGLRRGS